MISYIEALEALAQEGTMIRAGTRLRLTQSAISKRIQALEDELRQPLIEKRGRRVALTPQAVQFLEKTRPLFLGSASNSQGVAEALRSRSRRGSLRAGAGER